MNSVQDFGMNYAQPSTVSALNSAIPRRTDQENSGFPTADVLPPAFGGSSTSATAQQALAQRLQQAGYRVDDSRLDEIQRLTNEQKLGKENMMYMGAGLASMGLLGGVDPLYNAGERSTQKAGQFVKDNWMKKEWLDKYDTMGEATSLRQAGLERTTNGALKLADVKQRTGWDGFWNRNKSGVQAVNHKEYMDAAKQLKLQDLQKLHPDLPESVLRQMPESAVTGAGKLGKQVKQLVSPVTDAVGTLGKDMARGVGMDITPTPATSVNPNLPVKVEKYHLKDANFVKEVPPPVTTPKVGFIKEMKSALATGDKMKFAMGVGGKALGVAGIGITAYSVGSNAIDNYKNQNYRAIATDITGEAVGLVASSFATGAVSVGLGVAATAAVVAFPPLALLAPVAAPVGMIASGIIGGAIGQVATNVTKWAVDPFFKLFGLKNKDDDTRSEIKENRELLTNIAVGTGSAVGHALSTVPQKAVSNPSMFASPAANSIVKGALNF